MKSLMYSHKGDNINFNSFLIAFSLASNYIAVSLNSLISLPIYSMISILIFVLSVRKYLKFRLSSILYLLFLSLLPIVTPLFIPDAICVTYLAYFIQSIFLASCIGGTFSFKKITSNIILIYLAFFWGMFFHNKGIDTGGSLMGLSYAVLPVILASLYCIINSAKLNYSKQEKVLSVVALIYYLSMTINYISRGAVLSITVFILLLLLKSGQDKNGRDKYTIKLFAILCGVVITICFFPELIKLTHTILNRMNINISFINETVIRLNNNTLLDGRDVIAERSLHIFFNSPLYGNGTAAYARYYTSNYDHNIIFELLSEGGLIYLIINLVPLIYIFIQIIKRQSKYTKDYIFMCILLLCSSFIRLLFSYTLWREQGYWMLMLLFILRNKYVTNLKETSLIKQDR